MEGARNRLSLNRKLIPGANTIVFFADQFHQPSADFPFIECGSLVSQHRFSVGQILAPEKHQLEHQEIFCRQNFDWQTQVNGVTHSPLQLLVKGNRGDEHVDSNAPYPAAELTLFSRLPQ